MWDDSKLMGVSGTWTAKIKKIYSRGKTYAEKLSAGIDERLSLISKLEDPDNGGTERVQLMSCWLDELTLQAFGTEKLPKMNFRADLSDLSILIQSLTRVYKKIVFLMMGTLKN